MGEKFTTLSEGPAMSPRSFTSSPNRLRTITPEFGDSFSNAQVFDIVDNVLAWRGGLVLGPSDCGYCLWAHPGNPEAIHRLDTIRSDWSTTLALSVGTQLLASDLVEFNPVHQRLAAEGWPGGLTIVSNVRARNRQARSFSHNVRGGGLTLGVRTSRSTLERQVASESAMPIISAALYHGDGSVITSFDDAHDFVLDALLRGDLAPGPVLAVRQSRRKFEFSRVSTVVQLGEGLRPITLRSGDFDDRWLAATTSRVAPAEYGDAT